MLCHNLLHHPKDIPQNKDYLLVHLTHHEKHLERGVKEAIRIKQAYLREETETSYICMNEMADFARNVLPGIMRNTSGKDNKSEEPLRDKILEMK